MTDTYADGQRVRYRPGCGTYGYEDDLEADGRVPGVVCGVTSTGRIRVEFVLKPHRRIRRAVDATSLSRAE